MISMTLLSVSMITLGAVFYLKQFHQNHLLDILPVCCVALYQFSYGAGVSPLGHVFLGFDTTMIRHQLFIGYLSWSKMLSEPCENSGKRD